jgi:hypothetical protein
MGVLLLAAGSLTFLNAVSQLTWRRRKLDAIPRWLAIAELPLGLAAIGLALTTSERFAWIWLIAMFCAVAAEMILRSQARKAH